MLSSECVLFKIQRLFCIIMKQSLLLLLLLVNFIFCVVFLRIEFHFIKKTRDALFDVVKNIDVGKNKNKKCFSPVRNYIT
jgi:hypothetical protein